MPDGFLLRGARLVDPAAERDEQVTVLIRDGVVAAVDAAGAADIGGAPGGAETIDCDGLVLARGFVDLHTHLREPGGEDRETVASGTRAAALGGYTAVSAMANTEPVADNAAVIQEVLALASEAGFCDVYPVGAITKGLAGESLTEMGEMASNGVRIFSDDGHCVSNARLMRMAMEYSRAFDVVLAQHAQEPALTEDWQMHEGPTSWLLGLAGAPSEAEEMIVSRDLMLARLTGARIHMCHLSSKGSVEMVRGAKSRGIRVTAEVTPHHLTFTDADLVDYDTNFKVNPPLRSEADREALIEGLADGTIDAVATDHAPHAAQDKEKEFDQAPPGMIGLETALAAVLALVHEGRITMPRAVEALSAVPARILGTAEHGGPVQAGAVANLTVFDPNAEWVAEPPFASLSSNSAFIGRALKGRVVHTFYRGVPTVFGGKAVR